MRAALLAFLVTVTMLLAPVALTASELELVVRVAFVTALSTAFGIALSLPLKESR